MTTRKEFAMGDLEALEDKLESLPIGTIILIALGLWGGILLVSAVIMFLISRLFGISFSWTGTLTVSLIIIHCLNLWLDIEKVRK